MSTLIALAQSLGVSARAFAAAWNTDERTDDLATADLRMTSLADVEEHGVLETAGDRCPVIYIRHP